jgi:hypothetical protein
MKSNIFYCIMLYSFLFFYYKPIHAQPPSFDNDTADVPIDGGLSILVAVGIGYGIKRNLKQSNTSKKNKPAPDE